MPILMTQLSVTPKILCVNER